MITTLRIPLSIRFALKGISSSSSTTSFDGLSLIMMWVMMALIRTPPPLHCWLIVDMVVAADWWYLLMTVSGFPFSKQIMYILLKLGYISLQPVLFHFFLLQLSCKSLVINNHQVSNSLDSAFQLIHLLGVAFTFGFQLGVLLSEQFIRLAHFLELLLLELDLGVIICNVAYNPCGFFFLLLELTLTCF